MCILTPPKTHLRLRVLRPQSDFLISICPGPARACREVDEGTKLTLRKDCRGGKKPKGEKKWKGKDKGHSFPSTLTFFLYQRLIPFIGWINNKNLLCRINWIDKVLGNVIQVFEKLITVILSTLTDYSQWSWEVGEIITMLMLNFQECDVPLIFLASSGFTNKTRTYVQEQIFSTFIRYLLQGYFWTLLYSKIYSENSSSSQSFLTNIKARCDILLIAFPIKLTNVKPNHINQWGIARSTSYEFR